MSSEVKVLDLQENNRVGVSSLEPEEVRAKALTLRGSMDKTAIDLAEVLHIIYHKEQWRDFGFDSFEKYTESELDVGYRSAMASIQIISKMKEHGISMARARELGWGKMRALLPHLTSKNAESLLEMADGQSVRGIKTKLIEDGTIVPKEAPETHKFIADCSAAEAAVILDAIDAAKKRLGTESVSSALEYITQEWAMANEGDASQTSLQDIINFCERNYGVTLVVKEEEGESV